MAIDILHVLGKNHRDSSGLKITHSWVWGIYTELSVNYTHIADGGVYTQLAVRYTYRIHGCGVHIYIAGCGVHTQLAVELHNCNPSPWKAEPDWDS